MTSYDPDDPSSFGEFDESVGRQLDDTASEVTGDAAVEFLAKVTSHLPGGGEDRLGQQEMTRRVAEAFSRGEHLVVEAGTGIGKSLAYLTPAALTRTRVVIATATKNLQDQLAAKDAPLVAAQMPGLKVAVLKGRQNYLCLNRARGVTDGAQLSFDDGDEVPKGIADQMKRILTWSNNTSTGDRDELPFEVEERAWRQMSVTPQECLGRADCPQGGSCWAELARDRASSSDLVIVNAHLYASHLATDGNVLPSHEYVIFDEAHEILDIFAGMLGTSLKTQALHALAQVSRPLLGADGAELVEDLHRQADVLADALTRQYNDNALKGMSDDVRAAVEECERLATLIADRLNQMSSADADQAFRLKRVQGPATHLRNDLARLRKVSGDELLFLTKRGQDVDLEVSLVDLGPRLREDLWPHVSAILTSATIPVNLIHQLGLPEETETLRFESPFDYAHNSLLYVPDDFPERNNPQCEDAIIEELVTLIGAAGGRTLALFTNRMVMQRVADAVAKHIDTPVLVQGGKSRAKLIAEFRDDVSASLFAVTSFWQGVDVQGHSLSLVTIDRLPFQVPGDPLAEARRERSTNPFMEVDLPRATMLLAQGVGRLIRSDTDRGVVAVLDTRLAEARYRSAMINRLPKMKRTRDQHEVVEFLEKLRDAQ